MLPSDGDGAGVVDARGLCMTEDGGGPDEACLAGLTPEVLAALLGDRDGDGRTDLQESALGTDPLDPTDGPDIDGDGLGDFFELRTGWVVTVVGKDPYRVFSKPWSADYDEDGLNDKAEYQGTDGNEATAADALDPDKADTDEDTIGDKIEITRGTDPLARDQYVRFTWKTVQITSADDEGTDDNIEVHFGFYIQKATKITVQVANWNDVGAGAVYTLNKVYDYKLRFDETITCFSEGTYEDDDGWSDNESFTEFTEAFTYPITGSQVKTLTQTCSDGGIATTLQVDVITGVPTESHLTVDDQ